MRIIRTGISIPEDILKRFDELASSLGLSRSGALRKAMLTFISEHEWKRVKGKVAGALLVLYDHTIHEASNFIAEIQHHYLDIVNSALHLHLDEKRCLEIVAIVGEARRAKELMRDLEKVKGVILTRALIISLD
ncbi:MAG: nickel-responsive transcriptional regulator NikR [Thermoprotei archaeon]|nr:MAG: nickel-responsive transcriptional regulator NikR [Thermoprotei archaeon]RLF24058.1 MAG: nickel-responsive transcriptional regulator NikR [Thermoprotei archaeon]